MNPITSAWRFVTHNPILVGGFVASVIATASTVAGRHGSALEYTAALLPLALGFLARFVTVPWVKVAPLVNAAAVTTAQVYPSKQAWAEVIGAAVDSAAATATASGWPAPIGAIPSTDSPTGLGPDVAASPPGVEALRANLPG